jgi:hypothetical protein
MASSKYAVGAPQVDPADQLEEEHLDIDDNEDSIGDIVENPGRLDVLLGRGRTYRYHPGNLRFQGESYLAFDV